MNFLLPSSFLLPFLAVLMAAPNPAPGQVCPPLPPITPPWLELPAQPYRHVAMTAAGERAAHVYVMDTGAPLGRPFLFVEGIDFNLSGTDSPLQLGDFGWSAFLGCQPEGYPMMEYMPVLIDSLVARGFDPVLVDFEAGSGDISANAELLADILAHLREHRTDPRPMVVGGASMGGQIARLALTRLEETGEPHCTQLYLSLDSPHQGAHVPLGLQQLIHHLPGDDPDLLLLRQALESTAARQLLLRQWPSGGSLRNPYQAMLDASGWPRHCRNSAIANGGTSPLEGAGLPLLDYTHSILESPLLGEWGSLLDLEVHADPGTLDHPLAAPLAPVTCSMKMPEDEAWPWPLDTYVGHGWMADTLFPTSIDLMPGGTRPSMAQFVAAFNAALLDLDLPWPLCVPPISASEFLPHHSFIPTPSALGIAPPWHPDMMDNLAALSPFDALHVAMDNEPHSEVNPDNVAFVLDQLDDTESPLPPGSVTGTINLVESGDWGLPPLEVLGRLCLQSSDPEFGEDAAEAESHGLFRLQDCGGSLVIATEGWMELGGGSGASSATATLTVHDGATLRIEGTLILHPGSALTIEPGGTLELCGGIIDQRNGSHISTAPGSLTRVTGTSLWTQASHSTWSIEGNIVMEPEAHWQHKLFPDARWHTAQQLQFHMAEGSELLMDGLILETQWVLAHGAQVQLQGEGSLHQQDIGIRMLGAGRWSSALQGGTRFERAHWRGTGEDSLLVAGVLTIEHLEAQGIHHFQSDGEYRMEDADFAEGSTSMERNRVRWRGVRHDGHPVIHFGLEVPPAHLMESCAFEGASIGLEVHGPGRIRLEECRFGSDITGLKASQARVELACCRLEDNDAGLVMDRSLLVMTPEGGGGWNLFDHNDEHMRFLLAPPPEMQGGANHFGDHYSGWASGTLDLACSGGGIDWPIPGQSWNWPDSWPQFLEGLWAPAAGTNDFCPITAVDLMPLSLIGCGGEGRKE